ncbi:glucoamylase family protein [Carboxylicivirga sp. M1479]|uniref:glucoamylase family protein n=1 Tax=Carboxylicivirga sp. M1479 TaxID=2594476 RepID=UPI001177ED59|nr:glucoamylase family protein [Carboxylicivirga sp. M1479]TRX72569.1 T9SS type A sorting domain-containing protein [Carboxylicivirga sp. M1479]
MRTFFLLIIAICATTVSGQIIFFDEGTNHTYYDQGIVNVGEMGSSTFEHTYPPGAPQYNDKIPCVTSAYRGNTALVFNYFSSDAGTWMASVYRKDWSTADITTSDFLSFFVYATEELDAASLPLIAIKANLDAASGDQITPFYTPETNDPVIPAETWTQVLLPLQPIFDDSQNTSLNFTETKGIVFSQSETTNTQRTLYVDEISTYTKVDEVPEVEDLSALGYDSHVELRWQSPWPNMNFDIKASVDGGNVYNYLTTTSDTSYLHFFPQSARNSTIQYKIISRIGESTSAGETITVEVRDFSDEELLQMIQEYTFRYFWEGADSNTGMAKERTSGNVIASGASGMGLMAMIVAHERNLHAQDAIKDRVLMMLSFLENCDRYHGAWSHWYNSDGTTKPFSPKDDGGDLVETSFVAAALIALRNYFSGEDIKAAQIREKAEQLWREIEWTWYQKNGEDQLYWHWSPNYGFEMNMKIKGWNEALITYLMAASSPDFSIGQSVYDRGWAANGNMVNPRSYYDFNISLSPDYGGPLFWTHYTHLGIDPRELKDVYANYWTELVNTVKIHHAYAVDNPKGHLNYSDKCWGLTASDDPDQGYAAHQPWYNDNGTIAPTAAIASIPYTPEESMKAIKYFYRERGGQLFGKYGFYDAFNDNQNWVKHDYIGIDQGPILVMIENHRSALLWNNVMKDEEVQLGLGNLDFDGYVGIFTPKHFKSLDIFPNPNKGRFSVKLPELEPQVVEIIIYTIQGQKTYTKTMHSSSYQQLYEVMDIEPGWYIVTVITDHDTYAAKILVR